MPTILVPFALVLGCGPMGPNLGSMKLDFMTKEQHLRNNVDGVWATCRQVTDGSSKHIMDFTGSKVYADTYVYKNNDCSGQPYDSYKSSRFDYSNFVTITEQKGSADITLTSYYPNNLPSEEGVTKVNSEAIMTAHVDFELTPDNKKLHLVVSTITTGDVQKLIREKSAPRNKVSSNLSFDLAPSDVPKSTFSGLETNNEIAAHNIRYFKNPQDLESQISSEAVSVVGKSCLANYFSGHQAGDSPIFDSFFSTVVQKNHSTLTKQGYNLEGVQLLSDQDISLNPYIRFWFFYYKGGDEVLSEVACKNQLRPSGFSLKVSN